jgi:hypothetical protein
VVAECVWVVVLEGAGGGGGSSSNKTMQLALMRGNKGGRRVRLVQR